MEQPEYQFSLEATANKINGLGSDGGCILQGARNRCCILSRFSAADGSFGHRLPLTEERVKKYNKPCLQSV
jgi:hypothetical protein